MKESLTRAEAVRLDQLAREEYGVPGIAMMENAGAAIAREALAMLRGKSGPVSILCGTGNNGGDGFVVARRLAGQGISVQLFLACRRNQVREGSDAFTNLRIAEKIGLPLTEIIGAKDVPIAAEVLKKSSLLVDALLGTGLAGRVREPYLSLIRAINESGVPVLAVDIPSGLDCDTGEVLGEAVRADVTVTMLLPKVGFTKPAAAAYLGRVVAADIGTGFLLRRD